MAKHKILTNNDTNKIILELAKKLELTPSQVIEKVIRDVSKTKKDEEIYVKICFPHSIVFTTELPFAFPYEFEKFELSYHDTNFRIYLERVPKRYVIGRMPFKTITTVVVDIAEDYDQNKSLPIDKMNKQLGDKYRESAYEVLKSIIIAYRRVKKDYYNIGVIEAPVNLDEFSTMTTVNLMLNNQVVKTTKMMSLREASELIVKLKLEENLLSKICDDATNTLNHNRQFLTNPMNYYDAAQSFYYHGQWDLCLIQSVISMENSLSNLILQPTVNTMFLQNTTLNDLKKKYKDALGLPNKISKFLFPIINKNNLDEVKTNLKTLMPLLSQKNTQTGIYDLRSRIVHEGYSVNKEQAFESMKIAEQFLNILNSIHSYFQKSK